MSSAAKRRGLTNIAVQETCPVTLAGRRETFCKAICAFSLAEARLERRCSRGPAPHGDGKCESNDRKEEKEYYDQGRDSDAVCEVGLGGY